VSDAFAHPGFSTVLPWPGPERATDVLERGDGTVLALGMRAPEPGGLSDLLLIELDPSGDTLRTETLGGPESEIPGGMAWTDDGGLLIAFTRCGEAPEEISGLVLRLDPSLDTLWCATVRDGDRVGLEGIVALPGGGCIVAGRILTEGDPAVPAGLAALLDASGDTLWTATPPGSGPSLLCAADAGFDGPVFCGTAAEGPEQAVWLVATDWSGTVTLDVRLAPGPSSTGAAVEVTEGGVVVAGSAPGDRDGVAAMYLAFVDGTSLPVWEHTYGGDSWERAGALCETADGWLLAGTSRSSAGGEEDRSDIELVRTDAVGGLLWTRRHGTSSPDYGWGVGASADGGFLVAGCTSDQAGSSGYDAWVMRVDSLGNLPGLGHGGPPPSGGPFAATLLWNPCTDSVGLRLRIPSPSEVEVRLYDLFGRLALAPPGNAFGASGEQELLLSLDGPGGPLPPGIYLLVARCGAERASLAVTVLGGSDP